MNENPAHSQSGPKTPRPTSVWLVWLLRIVVGAVFVFSGISKAFDPWGFIFKIEEYLGAWGIDLPRTVILVGAIALSVYEFVFGLMLAVGSLRRSAPWFLLASMAVMLPLTGYIAFFGGVEDCGCFGDALKISNTATFIKNIVLTAMLVWLCRCSGRLRRGIYAPEVQWIVGVLATVYILIISLFGYNIQPLVDFRDYPAGTDLAAMTEETADDFGDYLYRYERDGATRDFAADELPDSTWTFVDRVTPVDTSLDTSKFTIFEGDDDVTSWVIEPEGDQLLLIIPEPARADISYSYYANEFNSYINDRGGSMAALIGGGQKAIERWTDLSMADYPGYTVDDTSLKEIARGVMSLVWLRDGKILWKRTLSSIDYDTLQRVSDRTIEPDELAINSRGILLTLTLIFGALLLVIALFQQAIMSLIAFIRKKSQKNNVTLHSTKSHNDQSKT